MVKELALAAVAMTALICALLLAFRGMNWMAVLFVAVALVGVFILGGGETPTPKRKGEEQQ